MKDQSPPTALVVEDEYPVGLVMEEMLKDRGFVVTVASTLRQGIGAIERHAC